MQWDGDDGGDHGKSVAQRGDDSGVADDLQWGCPEHRVEYEQRGSDGGLLLDGIEVETSLSWRARLEAVLRTPSPIEFSGMSYKVFQGKNLQLVKKGRVA